MLWETLNVMRDISRLHDITRVLIRYGGGDVVRLIGIGNILERAGRILHWKEASEQILVVSKTLENFAAEIDRAAKLF